MKCIVIKQSTRPEAVKRVLILEIPDNVGSDGEDGDGECGQHGSPERSEQEGNSTINKTDIYSVLWKGKQGN